jgi:hypothetical protein
MKLKKRPYFFRGKKKYCIFVPEYYQIQFVMKKIAVIFMLIITLFATSQAAVTFHFCGGQLHSIALASSNKAACCCEKTTSCCEKQDAHENGYVLQNVPCCSDLHLVISADDFTGQRKMTVENDNAFHATAFISPLS